MKNIFIFENILYFLGKVWICVPQRGPAAAHKGKCPYGPQWEMPLRAGSGQQPGQALDIPASRRDVASCQDKH